MSTANERGRSISRRGARLLVIAALALVVLGLSSRIHTAYMAALVLAESATPEEDGPVARFCPDPVVESVSFESPARTVRADVYRPEGGGTHPGIVLSHGVAARGKDDPRLVNFADALARAGYVALVPDFLNMKEFRVRPSDVDELVASYEYLEGRPDVDSERIGLFGFSYAGGLSVLAAADPRIADRVRFCFLLGGYYDLEDVLVYMTTGEYEWEGKWSYLEPRNSGRWAFLLNSSDLIDDERDRALLQSLAERKLDHPDADVTDIVRSLGPEGTLVYSLMVNDDPERAQRMITELNPRIREYLSNLSLEGKLSDLEAKLIIGHGRDDDLIPYTESLLLAERVPDQVPVHLEILGSFHHVDLKLGSGEGLGGLFASLGEIVKLYSLTYDLMAQGLL